MKYLAFLLSVATALAGVDGSILNRTTGKPQAGATVSLFKLGQAGPEMLDSVKSDAQGKFRFDRTLEPGPHNIQVAFDGVTYNHVAPPGMPTSGLEIEVYNSSRKPGAARVWQHMIMLEPAGQQLGVSDTYIFKNDGSLTYNDPDGGTLHFYVPAAGQSSLRVMATAPQGMPIQRAADKAGRADAFKLDFPIRPGETRIDITYTLPLSSPATFSSQVFYKGAPTRLVVPNGVTLQGEGLKSLGQEPQSQAAIYEVNTPGFSVSIQGTGSLRAASDDSGDDSGPQIQEILPRVYDRLEWILIPAFAALALGFALLYRKGQPAVSGRKQRG